MAKIHQQPRGGGDLVASAISRSGPNRGVRPVVADAVDDVRQRLESRLGVAVQRVDASRTATFTDRIGAAPELLAWLAPLVGTWIRMRTEAAPA